MNFSSMLTLLTDGLITLTLLYCVILERRISAFRKQEQAFRMLIGDVSEKTRLAEGAASSLRQMIDEVGKRGMMASNHPVKSGDGSVSALAARVAAMRSR